MDGLAVAADIRGLNWWESVKIKFHQVKCEMAKHPDLVFLCICTVMWLGTKYSNSVAVKQILSAPPPPQPVFPADSPVHDSYLGSMRYLDHRLHVDEIIFVMFYAPWSVLAMETRRQFHQAAEILQHQVSFFAVNCWWHTGQCAKKHKFLSYPAMYVFHSHTEKFKYTGALTAEHFVQFLERFLYPVVPLYTENLVREFTITHDPCVLGHFDFNSSPQPPGFKQFYFAALRALQKEPRDPVSFAIVTSSSVAAKYNITTTPSILYTHNVQNIEELYAEVNFTTSNIHKWLHSFAVNKPSLSWLYLPRRKSRRLMDIVKPGPTLLVFLPDNPLFDNIYSDHIRAIVYDYMTCDNSSERLGAARLHLRNHQTNARYSEADCNCTRASHLLDSSSTFCCSSFTMSHSYERCNVCHSSANDVCSVNKILTDIRAKFATNDDVRCRELRRNYNHREWTSLCCEPQASHYVPRIGDPAVRHLLRSHKSKTCAKIRHSTTAGASLPDTVFQSSLNMKWRSSDKIRGYACLANRTLSFHLLDRQMHKNFMQALEIDSGDARAGRVDVALLDDEREEHYILNDVFSGHSLNEFIVNYTEGRLTRYVRPGDLSPERLCTQDGDCITEVTTTTFNDLVLDDDKDVLLLHYATWCGYCVSVTDVYLSLARFFKACNTLVLARINSDRNDLPWQYTVPSYPTIQFFPARKKEESVNFPKDVAKTLPNLIKFVLQHSATTSDICLGFVLGFCTGGCLARNAYNAERIITLLQHRIAFLQTRLGAEERGTMYDKYRHDLLNRLLDADRRLRLTANLSNLLQYTDFTLDADRTRYLIHKMRAQTKVL